MAEHYEDILADRLNDEPPIFRGLSNSELGLVLKVAALIWIPVCLMIAGLFGSFIMGTGAAMLMILFTVMISGTLFQRIKRGRPDFYYQHFLMLRDITFSLKTNTKSEKVIRYSGDWGIGRIDGE